jgi:hypothetical protein
MLTLQSRRRRQQTQWKQQQSYSSSEYYRASKLAGEPVRACCWVFQTCSSVGLSSCCMQRHTCGSDVTAPGSMPTSPCLCFCRLSAFHQQLSTAKQEAAKAHRWRQSWEATRMEVEDLTGANMRAMLRRHELVASYWPVMARLNLAEDAVTVLTQQVCIMCAAVVWAGG